MLKLSLDSCAKQDWDDLSKVRSFLTATNHQLYLKSIDGKIDFCKENIPFISKDSTITELFSAEIMAETKIL